MKRSFLLAATLALTAVTATPVLAVDEPPVADDALVVSESLVTDQTQAAEGSPVADQAAEEAFAWREPFTIELPAPTRTITLRPRTDVAAFTAAKGLDGARVVPMGRNGTLLEVPMDEQTWNDREGELCSGPDVAGCDTAVCQSIQLAGSATAPDGYGPEAVQARLVRNPPESLNVPDEPTGEAGTCRGPPLVPPLDEAAAGTGQNVTIDLTLLDQNKDSAGAVVDKSMDTSTAAASPAAASGSAATDGATQAAGAEGVAQTAAADADATAGSAAEPAAAAPQKRSFAFNVLSQFNPLGGVNLGTDDLPADTSDWTLVVGAGCTEVKVPLNAIEPARLPGIVVALVDAGNVVPVANTYGLTVVRQLALVSTGQNLVVYATAQNIFTVIAAMAADARVDGAQPEYVFETAAEAAVAEAAVAEAADLPVTDLVVEADAGPGPGTTAAPLPGYSDPFAALNYGPGMTGALALQASATGAGQVIALIDTGVDTAHPDLAGRLREPVDTTGNGYAAEVHGTAVAGIIAATADNAIGSYGVAPAAEILPIKACQPKEEGALKARCTTSSLVSALDVAIQEDVAIINMSLAGPPDDLVARFINLALQQDRLVVAGAGNGGEHAKPGFPAAIPGVLAVTAVDVSDHLYGQANHGDYIDVAAPGVDIVSTAPNGQYPPLSGTSMAAAHVSGVAALIRELGPVLSAKEVGLIIRSNARDLGAAGADAEFGAGLVDACRTAAAATADAVSCSLGGDHADQNAI